MTFRAELGHLQKSNYAIVQRCFSGSVSCLRRTLSSSQPSPATSPLPGSWSGVVWRVPKQAEPFSGWESASARRMERGQYQIDGLKGPCGASAICQTG